jgi:hypothetical protein
VRGGGGKIPLKTFMQYFTRWAILVESFKKSHGLPCETISVEKLINDFISLIHTENRIKAIVKRIIPKKFIEIYRKILKRLHR